MINSVRTLLIFAIATIFLAGCVAPDLEAKTQLIDDRDVIMSSSDPGQGHA